jgi:hypothetical protein
MSILYNQRDATYTMFFIIISALHVSGGLPAHHQDLIKLDIVLLSCCLPLVWLGWFQHIHTSGRQQESKTIPKAAHTVL